MKRNALLAAMLFAAGSLLAADPKDTVTAQACEEARGRRGNYTWKQTVDAGEGGFGSGVTQGKTAGGLTWTSTPGFAFGGGDAPAPRRNACAIGHEQRHQESRRQMADRRRNCGRAGRQYGKAAVGSAEDSAGGGGSGGGALALSNDHSDRTDGRYQRPQGGWWRARR